MSLLIMLVSFQHPLLMLFHAKQSSRRGWKMDSLVIERCKLHTRLKGFLHTCSTWSRWFTNHSLKGKAGFTQNGSAPYRHRVAFLLREVVDVLSYIKCWTRGFQEHKNIKPGFGPYAGPLNGSEFIMKSWSQKTVKQVNIVYSFQKLSRYIQVQCLLKI